MFHISWTFSFNYVIPKDVPKSEALESVLNIENLYGERLAPRRAPPSPQPGWAAAPC
jgi:hypothetical protein